MREIEDRLKQGKDELENLEVPDDMEMRLRNALAQNKPIKNKRFGWKGSVAAALIAIMLIGYNFDTLAFYGKRLIGYDQVMNGTLKQLNELGNGQLINKSYTFENGVTYTLDGVMIDENQLLAFYTIEAPNGNVEDYMPLMELKGFISTYNSQSGQGQMNEEGTIMKNVHSFEPPLFFERTLDLKIRLIEENVEGEISFKIDRNKAMGHTLKQSINKTMKIDQTNIKFESILASPTSTVIKGSIQNLLELARDEIKGERFMPNHFELKLIANGKEVQRLGSGMSTDIKGITFDHEFDALPADIKSLELKLVSFSGTHEINETLNINKEAKNQKFKIHNKEVIVNKIQEKNGNTFLEITTEESIIFSRIYLITDGERIELNRTIEDKYDKLKDGRIIHSRTLEFPGTGNEYKLDIQRMSYSKQYNESIDIPLE